jgi:F0F1-type ATP synthase assembly protein I
MPQDVPLAGGSPMARDKPSHREIGLYFALAQVGLEMVAPLGLGLVVDRYFGWTPWATIGGAVFGLVSGLTHLVAILNRYERARSRPPSQDSP